MRKCVFCRMGSCDLAITHIMHHCTAIIEHSIPVGTSSVMANLFSFPLLSTMMVTIKAIFQLVVLVLLVDCTIYFLCMRLGALSENTACKKLNILGHNGEDTLIPHVNVFIAQSLTLPP